MEFWVIGNLAEVRLYNVNDAPRFALLARLFIFRNKAILYFLLHLNQPHCCGKENNHYKFF